MSCTCMYNHAVLDEAALRSGLPRGKMGIELHYFERIDSPNQRPGGLGRGGALGGVEGLHRLGLSPQIKWPNDVLLGGRKVSGVLAEAAWVGESLDYVILGIGVNVREEAVPQGAEMDFPATQVEGELGRQVERPRLLLDILQGVDRWYPRLGKADLLAAWGGCLG